MKGKIECERVKGEGEGSNAKVSVVDQRAKKSQKMY